jgi:hypothetical protein
LDASASETYSEQIMKCIEIALSCVENDRHKRPSIGDIIDKLNKMETKDQGLSTDLVYTAKTHFHSCHLLCFPLFDSKIDFGHIYAKTSMPQNIHFNFEHIP